MSDNRNNISHRGSRAIRSGSRSRPRSRPSSRPRSRSRSRSRPNANANANPRPELYYTRKIAARERAFDAELVAVAYEETERQLDFDEEFDKKNKMRKILVQRQKDRLEDIRQAQTRLKRRKKIYNKTVKNIKRHRKLNSLILATNIKEVNADFDARIAKDENERRVALQRLNTQYYENDDKQFERERTLAADKRTW